MHIITIQRLFTKPNIKKEGTKRVEPATIGQLYLYSSDGTKATLLHTCPTIENGGASSPEANKDRRIMPGAYTLHMSPTQVPLPREYAGRGVLLASTTDPNFIKRRIFIHAGNYPQDTEGCILLQSTYDTTENPGYGRGSMRAVKITYDFIMKTGVEHFLLYIRDESDAFLSLPLK